MPHERDRTGSAKTIGTWSHMSYRLTILSWCMMSTTSSSCRDMAILCLCVSFAGIPR